MVAWRLGLHTPVARRSCRARVYVDEPIGRWYRDPLSARSGGPPAGGPGRRPSCRGMPPLAASASPCFGQIAPSTSLHKTANMTSALACQSRAMLPRPALRGEGWGEGPLATAEVMQWSPKVPLTRHPRLCAVADLSPQAGRGDCSPQTRSVIAL